MPSVATPSASRRSEASVVLASAALMFACLVSAESPRQITNEEFVRSDRFLLGDPATDILNGDLQFQWIDGGNALLYRSQRPGRTQYLRIDAATGRKSPLFDHQAMASALSKALGTSVSADTLPVQRLALIEQNTYRLLSGKKMFRCDVTVPACSEEKVDEVPTGMTSPSGRHVLFSRDYNLWLKDKSDGSEQALTRDGVRGYSYGRPAESSTVEMPRRLSGEWPAVAALWSPDGRRFVSYRLDERHQQEYALVQAIPADGSFRPKLHTYYFDLPGERAAEASFFVHDVESGKRTAVDYPALPASNRVPIILGHLWWSADGRKLYMLDAPLARPYMKLIEVNPDTGATRMLIEEHADTTYFPNSIRLQTPNVRVLGSGDFIWFSERDGWGHLYLYNGKTGKLRNAITRGEWLVRDIFRIDERAGYVYFSGSGRERGQDVYNRHLYRVKLDGSALQLLTPDVGDHDLPSPVAPDVARMGGPAQDANRIAPISPNGEFIVDHFSTVQAPGRWLLRRKDGSLVARLEDEDPSPLPPFTAPEPFVVKSADGRFDLYGVILKPAHFDPKQRYPVVDCIYPGPQVIKAPKTFAGGGYMGGGGGYLGGAILGDPQAMADLGFVVVQVDGRGGPLRSKAFRDESYGRMETAGMLEDHIAAIRQLATTRPWLDIDRVGMFGSSGGGFATAHALIDYPDFFKVGVSSAGNHELRALYRIWGETWQGPVDKADYAKVFAGNDVSRFKGKLLLATGELDDNVHPAHTMRLVDALIRGNKQFDMLMMPNVTHAIMATPYFRRITENYLLQHLMGARLPSESDIVLPGSPPPPSAHSNSGSPATQVREAAAR